MNLLDPEKCSVNSDDTIKIMTTQRNIEQVNVDELREADIQRCFSK